MAFSPTVLLRFAIIRPRNQAERIIGAHCFPAWAGANRRASKMALPQCLALGSANAGIGGAISIAVYSSGRPRCRARGRPLFRPGIGTQSHVSGELFKMMTGTKIIHMPYRGGAPVMTDLLGGQVQLYFGAIVSSIEHIRSGRLRALGVTSAGRSQALPDVPAIGEFVAGYEASSVYGLGAPKSTPAGIVDQLNVAVNAGLADAKMKARLADLGCTVLAGTPADFGKLIADETEKWGKVAKLAGIKLG